MIKNNSGFTLIELILVIAILGILAVAVAPTFVNIQANAQTAQANGVAGAVRDGINMQFAQALANTGVGAFPTIAELGGVAGACAPANPCFGGVLQSAIETGWTVTVAGTYVHDATGLTFVYTPVDGKFE